MRWPRQRFSRRAARGQTLVLFALMSLSLIAMLGLVIDAGVNYAQRRNMQNAADTAALAGTRIISRINTFPYPGTKRGTVWSAVKETAIDNGVASNPALIQCEFVDTTSRPMGVSCNTDVDGNANAAIPYQTGGVRVRVSETHGTFFMRALGITASGTSAASRAQIRAMTFMLTNDVVFAVCGVNTATRTGIPASPVGKSDILVTTQVDDWTQPLPSPPALPSKKEVATIENTAIQQSSYAFDWNIRDPANLDLMLPQGGPTFHIYSPDIATCDAKGGSWQGAIRQASGVDIQMDTNGGRAFAPNVDLRFGNAMSGVPSSSPNCKKTNQSDFCIEHAINGTLGCKVGQFPAPLGAALNEPRLNQLSTDGCVMILPIVDNGYYLNSRGEVVAHDNNGSLKGRMWGAFYVFNKDGNYYGWLIKNYPVHEDGQDTWDWNYVGPITIALTKE